MCLCQRVRHYRSAGGPWRRLSVDHSSTWSSPAQCERQAAGRETKCPTGVSSRTRPPPQVPLTWSVTLVSGAGGPSAVVAGRWGRGDRGSPLLAHGRIHSWNTEALIYKSTFKSFVFLSFCKSLVVLNTFASCLSSFLNVFYLFTFYTGIYHSGNYWYILELAETFFCFILCL